jgi:hypothetical protein
MASQSGSSVRAGIGLNPLGDFPQKLAGGVLSLALLIVAIAAGQFDVSQVGEVEIDNCFERVGAGTGSQAVWQSCEPVSICGL